MVADGKNSMSTRILFNKRIEYLSLFDERLELNGYYIDFLYRHQVYGKSFNGVSIIPKKDKFDVYLDSGKKKERGVSFVVSAYESFKKEFVKMAGCLDKSEFKDIKVVSGYKNPEQEYKNYFANLVDNSFKNGFFKKKDFLNFSRQIIALSENTKLPFTFTDFINSKYCDPLCSGLGIEVMKKSHSDDYPKTVLMSDDNYPLYQSCAVRFGFAVDKNAPWRLMFNLYSDAAKPFIEKTEQNSVLEEYFEDAKYKDLDLLKEVIIASYRKYVNKKDVDKDVGFWFNLYLGLKLEYSDKGLSLAKKKKIIEKSCALLKELDFDRAMRYLEAETR